MREVKQLMKPYKSFYAANKELGVDAWQLQRWQRMGALVDNDGQVWIKTGKTVEGWVKL